jgi:hypothetical protein
MVSNLGPNLMQVPEVPGHVMDPRMVYTPSHATISQPDIIIMLGCRKIYIEHGGIHDAVI